jgi:hypothetical protein
MSNQKTYMVVLTVLLLVGLSVPALAQVGGVGSITGSIADPTGAVIPDTTVTATHQATGISRQAVTGGTGIYLFSNMQIGEYTLRVSATGFKAYEATDVRAVSSETTPFDIQLQVGDVTETVTIEATIATLDHTTETVGTTRTIEEIERLPIPLVGQSSRSAVSLYRTMSGVSFQPLQSGGQDFITFSRAQINGSMAGTFGYSIDGVEAGMGEAESASDFMSPMPESVEEFRIEANSDVSTGFNGGVAAILTTKSGSNEFHGSVQHYMRNEAVGARSFFDQSGETAPDKQNEGSFVVGGPIIKNKTFFFTGLSIYRFRQAAVSVSGTAFSTTTLPTQLMRQGDFSELLTEQNRPIFDPLTTTSSTGPGGEIVFTRTMFPGNVIPSGRLSPISQFLQTAIDPPNRPGTVQNWQGQADITQVDLDKWLGKIDHHFNENHRFSISYEATITPFLPEVSGQSGHSFIAGGPGYLAPEVDTGFIDDRDSYRYRFNYMWTVSPTMLFTFRGGVTRNPNALLDSYPFGGSRETFGCDAGWAGPFNCETPNITPEGFASFGATFNLDFVNPRSQKTPVNVNLSWIKGSHNLKFGVDAWFLPFSFIDNRGRMGAFSFTNRITGQPGDPLTGSGWASYLLGEVDNANITSPVDGRGRSDAWGIYFQDQWRMTPKFTLTVGLRWNYFTPYSELQDKIGTFDPNLPNPGADGFLGALSIYGDGPGRNGLHTVNESFYKAFSPHFGFAYSLDPKTVIRASYSLTFAPHFQKYYGPRKPEVPSTGFNATLLAPNLDGGLTSAFNWGNGWPTVIPQFPQTDPALVNGSAITLIDRGEKVPAYSQNLSFEIGRELPNQISIRTAYVGNLSRRLATSYGGQFSTPTQTINSMPLAHLSLGSLLNADIDSPEAIGAGVPKPYPSFTGSVAQALRPFPQYQDIGVFGAQLGNSSYHSLQTNFQKRSGDLTFLVAYTISKQISNTDFPGFIGYGRQVRQHPAVMNTARALDQRDRPQMLALSWVYDLPFGKGKKFVSGASRGLDYLVGGWRLSAIHNYMSGTPVRVSSSQTIPGGFQAIWPNRAGGGLVANGCGDQDPNSTGGDRFFLNSGAFTQAAPFTLGDTATLPTVRNCAILQENVQLEKFFPITENVRVHVGTLWQQALNRHWWSGLNTNTSSADYGRHGGVSPPRNITFYLKVEF